jgi:hypothetical protein
MKTFFSLTTIALIWFFLGFDTTAIIPEIPDAKNSIDPYSLKTSLTFEENHGQFRKDIRFVSRSGNLKSIFRFGRPQIQAEDSILSLEVTDAVQVEPVGLDLLEARSHYFLGRDPRKWLTDIPHFDRIRYPSILPGVDMEFYGSGDQLEFDFVLDPGVHPDSISFQFSHKLNWRWIDSYLEA